MIRILHVVTHMNRGGLETMLMNYYRHINRDKIQFDFLTHRPYNGDYGEEIQALGGIIYHISVLNPFSFSYRKELRDFFQQHSEYKIIHVHQDCMSSVILKEAKKCGVSIRIAHSHNASQDKNLKYLVKLFYKQSIGNYATDLYACSEDAGKWMFGRKTFTVLNNAIDADQYRYDEKTRNEVRRFFGIQSEDFVVGHVGRFCPQKNHTFLIDIFYELAKKKSDVKLLLVGNDKENLAELIKDKIKQLNLQDRVIFTGIRSDVNRVLQAMDIFVFPSLYEGLPVTLVEAQASGLRCLISDRVPIECKKTDLVEQIRLDSDAETWASRVLMNTRYLRTDRYNDICKADYDIVQNAEILQCYYENAERRK